VQVVSQNATLPVAFSANDGADTGGGTGDVGSEGLAASIANRLETFPMSALPWWSQPIDATLYLKEKRWSVL
jgi:hypothetical protein